MIKLLLFICSCLLNPLLVLGDTIELPPEEYWPQRVTVTRNCFNMAETGADRIKAGTTYVLVRVEPPYIFLSGRINAVKVKLSDTDFTERATDLKSLEDQSNRGINNSLLAGKLRRLGKDQFHPIQIEDSDKYKYFLFIYLSSESEQGSTIISGLKRVHEELIANDTSKVMVMFNYEPTPPALFNFYKEYEMPWTCVVFHMSNGYREAFQHEVGQPALVLTDKNGTILGKWSLRNADEDAVLKTISEARNSIAELDKALGN